MSAAGLNKNELDQPVHPDIINPIPPPGFLGTRPGVWKSSEIVSLFVTEKNRIQAVASESRPNYQG
jgi:hypothetical protein